MLVKGCVTENIEGDKFFDSCWRKITWLGNTISSSTSTLLTATAPHNNGAMM